MDKRALLHNYTKVFILAAIIGGSLLWFQSERIGKQAAALQSELTLAQATKETASTTYRNLEAEQQAHRAEYDPVQTVKMSYEVQEAKESFETAEAQTKALEPQYAAKASERERLLLWFVPLIALVLLHIVIAAMSRPQRDELAEASAKQRRGLVP